MGEVATLFHPERWLTEWKAAGGFVTIGTGPFAPGGEMTMCMLELGPTFPLSETADSPRRRDVERLKRQVAGLPARLKVIDHMLRLEATRGQA